jgi:hypothetical protein
MDAPPNPKSTPRELVRYIERHNEVIVENFRKLPTLFDDTCDPFVGLNHLNALYKESYFCALNGQYHAGIVVMSQLLEDILREIIHVHTDIRHGGTFEQLLAFVSGKEHNSPQPYLVSPEYTKILAEIKEKIRNPYIHLRYSKIVGREKVPVAKIPVRLTPKEAVEDLAHGITTAKNGNFQEFQLDPSIDPSISAVFKEETDKVVVFELAAIVYPLYKRLVETYLTHDVYEMYVKRNGSLEDTLTTKG